VVSMTVSTDDFATRYRANGWAPLPLPLREKAPTQANWQQFTADDGTRFAGNIGLLLGARSNGLVALHRDYDSLVVSG
jgi:hypothetical protein